MKQQPTKFAQGKSHSSPEAHNKQKVEMIQIKTHSRLKWSSVHNIITDRISSVHKIITD